jgi:uncharacterized iron-regulated membrane protein
VDPYSGQLVELYNHRESFFYFVMDLHRWLLAKDTGKLIMGISTLIFLVILITGIILWWPRTAKILRQRLNVKWTGGWKRLNHDLHIVLGFYASILLFIFSFTALAWSFQWFNDGIFAITNTPKERTPPPQSIKLGTRSADIDSIYNHCHRLASNFEYMNVGFPSDSAGTYSITVLPANASHESATDNYYYDQFTGELKKKVRHTEKPLGQRVRASFRPIHTSSIAGLPGKIIGFIICILGFTFPITGTILWINRLRKQRK